ncbi:CHAT domain-containing protein [Aquimarina sp. TRL1]|uniref:CHAT domain-containing protein n=1 Tax=Aquimarina sp. (strain TRL1) TaxID=2736252 RepID=UPI00158D2EE7|nr:CHAT domain-containing protein [Aquimarina sp. TRL1]QKX04374.1 CHAT domain-containing protein [Aquimarina sp. TRL1]
MRSLFAFFLICFFYNVSYTQENTPLQQEILNSYERITTSTTKSYPEKAKELHALSFPKKTADDSLFTAQLYHQIGIFNFRNSDYENAVRNTRRAVKIRSSFKDSLPSKLNNSLNNLAYILLKNDKHALAFRHYQQLINNEQKDRFTIKAYVQIVSILVDWGDYHQALHYLEEAALLVANNPQLQPQLYKIYLSFSFVYSEMESETYSKKAILFLQKAEKAIKELNRTPSIGVQLTIYNRYGHCYDELSDYKKAIEWYQKALSLDHDQMTTNHLTTLYNNIGYAYFKIKESDTAYTYYQKALEKDTLNSMIHDNLGDFYLSRRRYVDALQSYQKAISYEANLFSLPNYKKLPSSEVLLRAPQKVKLVNDLKDKAYAWLSYYQVSKKKQQLLYALETIKTADMLIDTIRSQSTEKQSKYFWRSKGVDLYMLATSVCYLLQKPAEAFYFMEKSKSLSLLENLTKEEARKRTNLPRKIIEKEQTLKHNILAAEQSFYTDTTKTKSEKLQHIRQQRKKLEVFIDFLKKQYPAYYALQKKQSIISLQAYRTQIQNGTGNSIQYMLSEDSGYGLFITKNQTHFFKIPEAISLNKNLRDIQPFFTKPIFSTKERVAFKKLSFAIYQALFPVEIRATIAQEKKIVVIPDHRLHLFPFESLITYLGKESNQLPFLIYDVDIHYQYSFSLLHKLAQKDSMVNPTAIAFAPVRFSNKKLTTLSRSEQKLNEIGRLFPTTLFTKEKASKNNFIKEAAPYSIVHLSTHANAVSNKEPWIAFHDASLSLSELYFIQSNAELVILDACKTALGEMKQGEGILSLSRGFFHAGANSVISSLWSTNEKSSNEIILSFYQFLKKGEDKSSALRKAKLQYLQTHQASELSPYFWAPLILNGRKKNVFHTPSYSYFLVIGGSILLLLLLIGGYVLFKKKNSKQEYAGNNSNSI